MSRYPNHRLVKVNRSYTVEEAATCLDVHKNSVRRWVKNGLNTIGGRGRTLILGSALRSFLTARREARKCRCPPGHFYCLKCRAPRPPAEGMTEYAPLTATSGNLKALCPVCMTVMHRRIKQADQTRFSAEWAVSSTQAHLHLSERAEPCLNVHLEWEPKAHENPPPR